MRRFILALCVLLFVLASCNCGAAPPLVKEESPFADPMTEHIYKSTIRILGICPDGVFTGTGFIAGPNKIITAKHIAYCDSNVTTPTLQLMVRTWDAKAFLAVPYKVGELDTAALKITRVIEGLEEGKPKPVAGEARFDYWARQTRRKPKIGERLCYAGGSVAMGVIKIKCGTVFDHLANGAFWLGVGGKGGNSGGPVFDRYGLVIGIATMKSNYGEEGLVILPSKYLPYVTNTLEPDAGTSDADSGVVE